MGGVGGCGLWSPRSEAEEIGDVTLRDMDSGSTQYTLHTLHVST